MSALRIGLIGNGKMGRMIDSICAVSYTHLRAHET